MHGRIQAIGDQSIFSAHDEPSWISLFDGVSRGLQEPLIVEGQSCLQIHWPQCSGETAKPPGTSRDIAAAQHLIGGSANRRAAQQLQQN